MNAQMLSELRAVLATELDRLEAEVDQLDREERESLSEASGENVYRDHMADQGSATFERELDMTLEESVRESLAAARAAMARIEKGSYGTCEHCGSQIPVERLEAVPTACLCIACKAAEEHR